MEKEIVLWHKSIDKAQNFMVAAGLQAYRIADEIMHGKGGILTLTNRGKDVRPLIVNALMDYYLKECCEHGELPFSVEEHTNSRNNSPYYLFVGKNIWFTVSRVRKNGDVPREADFRDTFTMNNDQLSLFPGLEPECKKDGVYAILTHGGNRTLDFMRFGIPRVIGEKPYKYTWIENLALYDRNAIHLVMEPLPVIEVKKPTLKNFIVERLVTDGQQ